MGRIWLWGATKVWSTLSCKRQKCIIELKCIQLKISRITFYLSRLNTLFNFQHLFVPSELFLFDTSLYPKHQLIVHLFRPWEEFCATSSTLNCVADLRWKEEAGGAGWRLERVLLWRFKSTCESFSIYVLFSCPTPPPRVNVSMRSSCSRAAGRSTARTWRRWGSCGSACSASTPRTLTSESTSSVSGSTAASPPSTSSGRRNISLLKVGLCDKSGSGGCYSYYIGTSIFFYIYIFLIKMPVWVFHKSFFFVHIPDPFDLNHNLGAGLSRKSKKMASVCLCCLVSICPGCLLMRFLLSVVDTVTNFIMKAFINGRTVYGTPVTDFPPAYPSRMVSVCCLSATFPYCSGIKSMSVNQLSASSLYLFYPAKNYSTAS